MSGQIWSVAAEGGYFYSDELSNTLRMQVQPLTKFRQLCDAEDGSQKGLNRGDAFHWNVYSTVGTQGRALAENQTMPETGFTVAQRTLTVVEAGNSVPYTGKLEALGKQDVVTIIDKTLKDDARKYFDIAAHTQFKATPLRVAPTGGTSTTAVTLTTNGATATSNNIALGSGHIKAISDTMKERNIPPYVGDDYISVSHPSTYRTFKNEMETKELYTDQGMGYVYSGEIGRYEGFRFIEQNFIPKGGSNGATTWDPYTGTAQAWANGLSSWAYFIGGDTVTEGVVIPEEIRAKLPGDFGRSKGIAWYYLGGFGLVHTDATNARVVMWDSLT
jgi:N4-gp56 family major capsid protein